MLRLFYQWYLLGDVRISITGPFVLPTRKSLSISVSGGCRRKLAVRLFRSGDARRMDSSVALSKLWYVEGNCIWVSCTGYHLSCSRRWKYGTLTLPGFSCATKYWTWPPPFLQPIWKSNRASREPETPKDILCRVHRTLKTAYRVVNATPSAHGPTMWPVAFLVAQEDFAKYPQLCRLHIMKA